VFALDANALIHALKGKGGVRERIENLHPSDLGIPSVIAYEVEVGTLRSSHPLQRRRDLDKLLSALTILPFDHRSADRAARLRFDLEKKGVKIGPLDTLIAGTVLAHAAILITHNTREFSRIPGLQVEDWF
jgi:tRNA(fMet)-specific endonuclease VapC